MEDKNEIKRQALRKAVRFFGSVQAHSNALGIGRSRISNWLNQGHDIPYQYAVITEELSKISLDCLSPFTKQANDVIKRLRNHNHLSSIEIPVHNILIKDLNDQHSKQVPPIIIDPKGVLIAGLEQLKAYKAADVDKVLALVLDWEKLV